MWFLEALTLASFWTEVGRVFTTVHFVPIQTDWTLLSVTWAHLSVNAGAGEKKVVKREQNCLLKVRRTMKE